MTCLGLRLGDTGCVIAPAAKGWNVGYRFVPLRTPMCPKGFIPSKGGRKSKCASHGIGSIQPEHTVNLERVVFCVDRRLVLPGLPWLTKALTRKAC